jgi:hypothetical protein
MLRRTLEMDPHTWLFGATLGVTAIVAVGLAGLAVYCAWMGLRIPATHAAFASGIVINRVRRLLMVYGVSPLFMQPPAQLL